MVTDEEFEEIEDVIEMSENAFDFSIEEKPLGEFQREEEYDHIEGIWVNQTTNGGYIGDEFAGTISIKIQDDKYFQFHYYM